MAQAVPADNLRNSPDRRRREIFLVIATCTAGMEAVAALRADHLAYLQALEESGQLLLAGPTLVSDGQSYAGNGCFIIVAGDLGAARAIAGQDPYHAADIRLNIVTPWLASGGVLFDDLWARPNAADEPGSQDVMA
jgi:uncharacterized protein